MHSRCRCTTRSSTLRTTRRRKSPRRNRCSSSTSTGCSSPARGRGRPCPKRAVPMDKAQREERAAFYAEAARHTPILAVPVRDATFLVETSDLTVGQALFLKRNRREFHVLARAVELLDDLRPKAQPE